MVAPAKIITAVFTDEMIIAWHSAAGTGNLTACATLTRATGITISTGIAAGVHGKMSSAHLTTEQTNAALMTSFTILTSVIGIIFITASGTLYVALAAFNAHLAFGAEIVFMYRVSARKAKSFILADRRHFA